MAKGVESAEFLWLVEPLHELWIVVLLVGGGHETILPFSRSPWEQGVASSSLAGFQEGEGKPQITVRSARHVTATRTKRRQQHDRTSAETTGGSHSDQTGTRYLQVRSLEHRTLRHANRILIEGDPLPVRLTRPRTPKAAK